MRLALFLSVLPALACSACSVVVSTPKEQCAVDADCDARGFANAACESSVCVPKQDPIWGCVGHISGEVGTGMVHIHFLLLDVVYNSPLAKADVKLCSKYDTTCATPIYKQMPVDPKTGAVDFDVPANFLGYLDVVDPDHLEILLFVDTTTDSGALDPEILVPTEGIVSNIAKQAHVMYDDTKSLILLRTTDCRIKTTGGVSMSIFPQSGIGFYLIDSVADTTASVTDAAGNAGFVNVDVGTPTITGTLGPHGETIGKVTTLTRAHTASYVVMHPTVLQ
jgi:hypothetical protein